MNSYKTQSTWFYLLGALNFVIVISFWWHGSGAEVGRSLYGLITGLGRLCGLFAALFIMLEFIFMSRLPALERSLGRATQTKLHKWAGYAGFSLIFAHFTLLSLGYAIVDRVGVIAQFLSFVYTYEDVYQALIALVLLIMVVGLSVWIVRRHLKYETWFYVHLLSYLAILLAFSHQLKVGPDFISQPLFVDYWYGLYIATFLMVVVYRFLRPLSLSWRHSLKVDRVVAETRDIYSIYITGRNLKSFKFEGGQFAIWWFLSRDLWSQGHPFSFSNQPGTDELRLTFKKSGDYTAILPAVKPGTSVILDGPYGIFTARISRGPKLLLIAGGIGLTPLASLLPVAASSNHDIILLYSARTAADLALRHELDDFGRRYGAKITYVISDDPTYKGETGILDQSKLQALVPDAAEREIFLCGPPPMMKAVSHSLQSLGVSKNLIHTEDFSF